MLQLKDCYTISVFVICILPVKHRRTRFVMFLGRKTGQTITDCFAPTLRNIPGSSLCSCCILSYTTNAPYDTASILPVPITVQITLTSNADLKHRHLVQTRESTERRINNTFVGNLEKYHTNNTEEKGLHQNIYGKYSMNILLKLKRDIPSYAILFLLGSNMLS